jgi:Stage II sporulation protein E (SpoIIE)
MRLRARARRSAVPLAGILLVLSVAGAVAIAVFSPVAAARRSHESTTTTAPQASAPASEEGSEATGRAHRNAGATQERAAAREEARREKRAAKHAAEEPTESVAASGEEAAAEEGLSAGPQAVSKNKRKKEKERERRRERREAKHSKGAAGEEGAGGEEEQQAVEATQPVASTTPATIAASDAGPSSASTAPTVVGAAGVRSSRGSKHAAHTVATHKAEHTSPALAGAKALPAASAASPRAASAPKTPARKRAGKTSAKGSSPIVHTVTQIIDVVPFFVRVLIAALLALSLTFAISSQLAARRAARLARQRLGLLEDVGLLQEALLPALPERVGEVGTSAAYRPASGPGAGGDFYDLFELEDGRVAVILGDVSGHGRTALPHTTLVRFTLRAYVEAGMTPREALQTAAPVLERQLDGSFATVVLSIYDPAHRTLSYACAGHPPPVFSGSAPEPNTACSAPPIGVGWPTGTRQTELLMEGAGRACFYTDGVIEAKLDGELFGAERLRRIVDTLTGKDGAQDVLDRVAEQSLERPDDMAACVLELDGPDRAISVLAEEVEIHRRELGGARLPRFLASGGLAPQEIEAVLAQAENAVRRDGSVVLRMYPGEERPRIELVHNNVARMRITARADAGVSEVAV